jgi:predicted metalloprotease with PDZ domain
VALWLDATIRLASHDRRSLDDVMFAMVRTRDRPLTQARILATIGRYIPLDARPALEAAVMRGAALPAPDRLPAVTGCAIRSVVDVPTFDLGFDLATSRAAGKIAGVRADSAAYAAGLRDGQVLTGRISVTNGDPQRTALLGIRDDAGERVVQFFPAGQPVQASQYQVGGCGTGH